MSRIKAGLELAIELKEEEQLEELVSGPTEETVEEFQVEDLDETIAAIDESFGLAVEGIWGDFKDFGKAAWRDFGPSKRADDAAGHFKILAQSYARKSAEAKDAHDMDTALKYRDLSWYYSLMSGKPPSHIKDADQFKYDIEQKYSNEIKSNLNELKEPATDDTDIDNDDYLKNLTRKKVKKEYEKSLPKGHTNLAKKYNLKEISDEMVNRYRQKKDDQLTNIAAKAHGDKDAKVLGWDDFNSAIKRLRGTDLDVARTNRKAKRSIKEADKTLKNHPWTGADVIVKTTGQKGVVMYVTKEHTFSAMVPFVRIYKVQLDDGTLKSFRLKDLKKIGSPNSDEQVNEQDIVNPKDTVTLDIPLLIRLLEYAREDAKTDMDLHDLTEKLVALGSEGGKTLSMSDYDQLVTHDEPQSDTKESAMEAKNPAMARTKAIAKMEKNADSFKKAMKPEGKGKK